jgi:TRAP-type C4-dicarboxylate transport system permease small subunit
MSKTALAILCGFALCAGVAFWLMYSTVSLSWETEYPDGSIPITWRSGVALLLLLAVTQGISFLFFRLVRLNNKKSPAGKNV